MIYICGRAFLIKGEEILFGQHALENFLGRKNTKELEKRAIATKAAQVCFSSFLESLPIFDFSVHLSLDI